MEKLCFKVMFTRNVRFSYLVFLRSFRSCLSVQLLPVTQQAGGPRNRKLPGFTVASEAPRPLLAVLHLSREFGRLD